jgi:hypothetical protein
MSIILDEQIVAIWFLATMEGQDWLCGLRELIPDEKYSLTYRFRYYKDEKAFDSQDEKNWYEAEISGTRNYALLIVRDLAKQMKAASMYGEPLYEFVNNGDFDDFKRRFDQAPFLFARSN